MTWRKVRGWAIPAVGAIAAASIACGCGGSAGSPSVTATAPDATTPVPAVTTPTPSPRPAAGTFTVTGPMMGLGPTLLGRLNVVETATLLGDGRVLVIGTDGDAEDCLAGAQLYDPITGTFTSADALAAPRPGYCGYAATLLRDGRVLVTSDDGSAQLYDSATGRFSRTGSMKNARQGYAATLMADGRVLVVGGYSLLPSAEDPSVRAAKDLSSAELYDPATGEFTATGSMRAPRWSLEAVRLDDGRVLVVGASVDAAGAPEVSAELYDPATGRFAPTGSMSADRSSPAAALLSDGRVLVTGGWGESSADLYDPATGVFAAIEWAKWASPAYLTPLADGRVLVVAGRQQGGVDIGLFDPTTGALTPTGSRPRDCGHVTAAMPDGRILFPGERSFLYWP